MHKEHKKNKNSATKRDNKRASWWELADSIERIFREFCDKATSDAYLDALYVSRNDEARQIQLFAGQHPIGCSEKSQDSVTMRKTYKIHSEHGAALVVSQAVTGDVGIILYPYSSEKLKRQEDNIIWGYYCNPDRITISVIKKAIRDFIAYIRVSSACHNETAADRLRIGYLIIKGRKYKEGFNIAKIIFSHWSWGILFVISSIASIQSAWFPSKTQPEMIIQKTETIKYIEKEPVNRRAHDEVKTHNKETSNSGKDIMSNDNIDIIRMKPFVYYNDRHDLKYDDHIPRELGIMFILEIINNGSNDIVVNELNINGRLDLNSKEFVYLTLPEMPGDGGIGNINDQLKIWKEKKPYMIVDWTTSLSNKTPNKHFYPKEKGYICFYLLEPRIGGQAEAGWTIPKIQYVGYSDKSLDPKRVRKFPEMSLVFEDIKEFPPRKIRNGLNFILSVNGKKINVPYSKITFVDRVSKFEWEKDSIQTMLNRYFADEAIKH